jgi:hypothetical protein
MPYVLRFVQRFRISDDKAFMDLERQFAALEKRVPGSAHPRRMRPIAGREPVHTLVWECEFPALAEVHTALEGLAADPEHTRLLALQSPMMIDAYTEIYEVLDF